MFVQHNPPAQLTDIQSRNPNQVKAYIPLVDSDAKLICLDPSNIQDQVIEKNLSGLAEFTSKAPVWNPKTHEYALNFGSRVTLGSMKNIQLVDAYDDTKIYLQFGKFANDKYHLDFAFPFSISQALSICLSTFE